MAENMTKTSFDAVMSQYGDKICAIYVDNGVKIRLRQSGEWYDKESGWITSKDISTVTIGDTDFVQVKRCYRSQGTKPLHSVVLYPLSVVQGFAICDEEPEKVKKYNPVTKETEEVEVFYRLDPLML